MFRKIRIKTHVLTFDQSAVYSLEPIQTAQQGRLATARRADNSEHGLGRDFKRDARRMRAPFACLIRSVTRIMG